MPKKKLFWFLTALVSILFFTSCIITAGSTMHAGQRRSAPPSVTVVEDDPELVVINGTYVYWLDGQEDVYFYGGYWWRSWGNNWYHSESYRDGWTVVEVNRVPHPVRNLPSAWRNNRHDSPRVRWNQTRSNWQGWENDRYWEKRRWRR